MSNNSISTNTMSAAYSSSRGRVHNPWVPTKVSRTRQSTPPINSVSVGHVVVGENTPQESDE